MNDLDNINNDIEKRREEQKEFKELIVSNILKTFRYYRKFEKKHLFHNNVKIENYKLKSEGAYFKLYIDKKYILGWKHTYIYEIYVHKVNILYFDNFSILEMQDFNDKFVEIVKERLLDLKEKEENMAIEMVALKSLA